METTTFVEKVRQQFIDGDDIDLSITSEFRQIDSYDSLTGMTILVMIKDEYGVEISDNEYRSCKTLNELFGIVKSKQLL